MFIEQKLDLGHNISAIHPQTVSLVRGDFLLSLVHSRKILGKHYIKIGYD
jgi:hypothetical protein